MSTRELLACPDFMRLWWARLAGVAASQMMLVAIGWQMYDLTGAAWDLGLVGLLQFLPALALVLVAGHVVDRHHRARIIALCVAAQGLVALLLAAAPFDGLSQRTLLLALSVVLGAVRAFQMPAQQALVPLLVPPALLPRAMAFSSAGLAAPSAFKRLMTPASSASMRLILMPVALVKLAYSASSVW